MQLDKFDIVTLKEIENTPGDKRGMFLRNFGWKIASKDNARKKATSIAAYLRFKAKIETKENVPSPSENGGEGIGGIRTAKRVIALTKDEALDPETIMRKMGYEPGEWELLRWKAVLNDWDVTMKLRRVLGYDDEGKPYYVDEPETHTNYQYKCELTLKPIKNAVTPSMLRKIWDEVEFPDVEPYKYKTPHPFLLELPILDFHLGKRAGNMCLEKEVELYKLSIMDILGQLSGFNLRPELIHYILGQDFFHVDGINEATSYGTPMKTTAPWSEIYKTGTKLLLWTVEQLRPIAPVELIYVPGNHDSTSSLCAADMLEHKYYKEPNVIVDAVDYPRKYRKYGITLLGHSHGRDEGKQRIKTIMQEEAPEMWGATSVREFHLGDLHHEEAKEEGGIIFRRMSAITEHDGWHIGKAYTAKRKAQAILWDKELGKRLTIDSNVMV